MTFAFASLAWFITPGLRDNKSRLPRHRACGNSKSAVHHQVRYLFAADWCPLTQKKQERFRLRYLHL
jgi:hypothetical protein